jgi:muramoyltetrapeptide carboxypeptidase
VELGPGIGRPRGYLAATDAERLRDLNAMLRRPDIDVLWFARGGYGSIRLLEQIDFAAARKWPKRWIGYSDLTALQIALLGRTGLPSYYGPMVVELGNRPIQHHFSSLDAALRGHRFPEMAFSSRQVRRSGRGAGPLVGGCLSVLCSLMGTPYEPDLDGKVLFWEEVGEEPYRIDRYLYQLRLAGKLRRLRGMLVGALVGCDGRRGRPTLRLSEILDDVLTGVGYPVITGLPFGHGRQKWTVPIGYRASIDTGRGTVRITAP